MITLDTISLSSSLKPPNLNSQLTKLKPPNLNSQLTKLKPPLFHHQCKTLIKRKKINKGNMQGSVIRRHPVCCCNQCVYAELFAFYQSTVTKDEEEESDSGITTTDTRIAVMGIISFIPYFNWLSWVFAWLDTGKTEICYLFSCLLGPLFEIKFVSVS
ncbi:hypothetical protein OIU77_026924 [Salix suchowensis]|uniref:Uncharacterized protein n=1 Tax=Salix suchowensis TaxID=1278906 RepID=A0ABQ9BMX2_9ROSI|nr:hypothetical protein OIU77_026924 [Salix suchowensis]